MYCFYCGRILENSKSTLYCKAGDMYLSKKLNQIMLDRFKTNKYNEIHNIGKKKGHFFCPECGLVLNNELKCDLCSKSIKDLLFQIIEFHPHKDV